ncbi:DUF4411 family protein [Aestuariivivens insulae]|uniref:DUF4411 family protein n=1 Tax=Aestuariivivens insulae TaxID=1621988 RepID=UPI001F5AB26F|nr:DUF4411 family protein [Aestuariivivens insulae]
MLYILDTNILVYPDRISHPMDIYPSYWDKMADLLRFENVISIDKVKDEIYRHQDGLTNWCKLNTQKSFWALSVNCMVEYAEIQNWAQNKDYNERALIEFADSKNADAFLVAYALNKKRVEDVEVSIVTLEVSAPESKRAIKIPDICLDFDIRFINNNDFFREIKASF